MNEQQHEALRLAECLEKTWWRWKNNPTNELYAAAELRRLYALNTDLLEALKELLDREWQDDEGDYTLEMARRKARAAIAKATGE